MYAGAQEEFLSAYEHIGMGRRKKRSLMLASHSKAP
jgi:hypothetical protein